MTSKSTEGLKKYRKERTIAKEKSAREAIAYLIDKNEVVSFKAVAVRAGVTRSYLYGHQEIRDIIEKARPTSIKVNNTKIISFNPKLASLESKYTALTRRYKRVLSENEELKNEIKTLRVYIEKLSKNDL